MFDNANPYTLRKKIIAGFTHYYIHFLDGEGAQKETEVHRRVFLEFRRMVRTERNMRRWDERHIEQSILMDETLYNRSLCQPRSVEETALGNLHNEQLQQTIQSLPEIQRRRFVLCHEFGLTYVQIAEMEGCTKMAVKYTIDKAKAAIAKKLENI
ncbi:MAG: hypothetical protein LBH91_05465 [Prevotellaceae bacterium]|jgi:RNA polymerase sigma-70 factor (ECF subfamily)|nr:hypothetical protein [Prevotellaceae bacterium]